MMYGLVFMFYMLYFHIILSKWTKIYKLNWNIAMTRSINDILRWKAQKSGSKKIESETKFKAFKEIWTNCHTRYHNTFSSFYACLFSDKNSLYILCLKRKTLCISLKNICNEWNLKSHFKHIIRLCYSESIKGEVIYSVFFKLRNRFTLKYHYFRIVFNILLITYYIER